MSAFSHSLGKISDSIRSASELSKLYQAYITKTSALSFCGASRGVDPHTVQLVHGNSGARLPVIVRSETVIGRD